MRTAIPFYVIFMLETWHDFNTMLRLSSDIRERSCISNTSKWHGDDMNGSCRLIFRQTANHLRWFRLLNQWTASWWGLQPASCHPYFSTLIRGSSDHLRIPHAYLIILFTLVLSKIVTDHQDIIILFHTLASVDRLYGLVSITRGSQRIYARLPLLHGVQ
jgi:hypothetical protein